MFGTCIRVGYACGAALYCCTKEGGGGRDNTHRKLQSCLFDCSTGK